MDLAVSRLLKRREAVDAGLVFTYGIWQATIFLASLWLVTGVQGGRRIIRSIAGVHTAQEDTLLSGWNKFLGCGVMFPCPPGNTIPLIMTGLSPLVHVPTHHICRGNVRTCGWVVFPPSAALDIHSVALPVLDRAEKVEWAIEVIPASLMIFWREVDPAYLGLCSLRNTWYYCRSKTSYVCVLCVL